MRWLTTKRKVRLHLKGDFPSFDGVYVGTDAGHYVLAKAVLVADGEDAVALDGETWVPKEDVLFMQVTR